MRYAQYIPHWALSRINTNTPVKSIGWRGPKGENRNNLEDVAGRDKPKKKGKEKVQMKDVEEAIKACDGIVERREGSSVRKKRRKASVKWTLKEEIPRTGKWVVTKLA